MPLPAGFSGRIPGFVDGFWNDESKVNGLWNSIFSQTFPQDLSVGTFLICPESIPSGVQKLRPDLLVSRLTNPNGSGTEHLVYEGKSEASKDDFAAIGDQLNRYFTSRSIAVTSWALGAKGNKFMIWKFDGQLISYNFNEFNGALTPTPPRTAQTVGFVGAMSQAALQALINNLVLPP